MILLVAELRGNSRTIAKVENKFNDAFGYDVFFSKRRQTINLPNRVDSSLDFGILRDVKVAVHLVSIIN